MARPRSEDYQRAAELRSALRRFLRVSEQTARRSGLTPQRYLLLLMIKGAPDGSERSTVTGSRSGSSSRRRSPRARTTGRARLIRQRSSRDGRVATSGSRPGERRLRRARRSRRSWGGETVSDIGEGRRVSRVGVGASTAPDVEVAAVEAVTEAGRQLGEAPADLALLFLSPDHLPDGVAVAIAAVMEGLDPGCLVGCVAQGIIGGEREVESGPPVWAASRGRDDHPFRIAADEEDGDVLIPDLGNPTLITLFADPFSLPLNDVLDALGAEYPGTPVVGGIATGGRPGLQAMILDGTTSPQRAVGVALAGDRAEAVVSQGCSLGQVLHGAGNIVLEQAGRPAYERLREIVGGLSPHERELVSAGLLAGLVVDENKPAYERGDFLMRGILGVDEETGAIAIGERVRVGQTLRFHVRDADTAGEELRLALAEALDRSGGRAAGALLFSCNGRGTRMFPTPDHDSRAVASMLGSSAVGGFFCGGEIGPVGGRSFSASATMVVFPPPGRHVGGLAEAREPDRSRRARSQPSAT
jgi:small ligand-binding sensory domain FIST